MKMCMKTGTRGISSIWMFKQFWSLLCALPVALGLGIPLDSNAAICRVCVQVVITPHSFSQLHSRASLLLFSAPIRLQFLNQLCV